MTDTEQKDLSLSSRIVGNTHVSWRDLKFIQQDDFKEWTVTEKEKLKASLKHNRFAMPFFVWYNGVDYYCLDGKHRTIVLEELEAEGVNIPANLPAILIDCADEADAARMVLLYSSSYARVTEEGLNTFMTMYNLKDDLLDFYNLDGLSMDLSTLTTDFGAKNEELDIDSFTDTITMKLEYSRADYLQVKELAAERMKSMNLPDIETVIKTLLNAGS